VLRRGACRLRFAAPRVGAALAPSSARSGARAAVWRREEMPAQHDGRAQA
jgi:hypothetical protein